MAAKEPESELIRAKDLGIFDRWALPSFDAPGEEPEAAEASAEEHTPAPVEAEPEDSGQVEEIAIEDVKPLTLDELEAIRQDAYNEGFAAGEKDGFHAGQIRARQEADAALAVKVGSLEKLMAQLLEPIAEQDQQMEVAMVRLVSHMVREVIQRELNSDSSQIRQVLREALKLLPMGADNVRIHVNPQDFDTIKALRERHEESWRILEDDSLRITVTDAGPGFAPAMLKQLGKPYQSSKGRPGGGLGLFLAVNVARTLGGRVTARNRALGGAVVTITLPLVAVTPKENTPDHGH